MTLEEAKKELAKAYMLAKQAGYDTSEAEEAERKDREFTRTMIAESEQEKFLTYQLQECARILLRNSIGLIYEYEEE